jgi:RNA-binding protein
MRLAESEKRRLRGLAHALKPCIHVGTAGVTDAVVKELGLALDHHELLKVRIRAGDRDQRDGAVAVLLERSGATLVSRIGNMAVLYRPKPAQPAAD